MYDKTSELVIDGLSKIIKGVEQILKQTLKRMITILTNT